MPRKVPLDPALVRMALIIVLGAMAVILNTTIVAVALPTFAEEFGVGIETVQWVTTGYLLAMFAAIPLTGWAQKRIGGKRLWLGALAAFTLGSILCAFAWDATSLIVFRVVQGVGGGVVVPLMATLLMQASGGRNVGTLMSVVGLPAALGPILGPVVGGVVLYYLPWEWLFLVNVPFGIAGFWLAYRTFPADPPASPAKLDVLGAVLTTVGIVALVFGLSNVAGDGGVAHADVLVPGGIGVTLLGAYVLYALRRGDGVVLDLRLLRHGALTSSSVLMALAGITLYGAMFLLPLFYQELRGQTALATGLILIPQGVGALMTRTMAGRLSDAIGPRWIAVAGFGVVALATVPFAFAGAATDPVVLGVVLFLRGLGMGALFIPLMAAAYIGLRHHEIPDASIITRVGQQIGGSAGVAFLAVVLTSHFTSSGATGTAAAESAFQATFWWLAGATAVGAVLSLLLPGHAAVAPPDDAVVEGAVFKGAVEDEGGADEVVHTRVPVVARR